MQVVMVERRRLIIGSHEVYGRYLMSQNMIQMKQADSRRLSLFSHAENGDSDCDNEYPNQSGEGKPFVEKEGTNEYGRDRL